MVSRCFAASMSMTMPPGCRLISAMADARVRSSSVRMGMSTMAHGGGSARRMAVHATVNDAFRKSTRNVANSTTIAGQFT